MSKQLTLAGYDIEGFGDLEQDKLCEHCGCLHNTAGPYCGVSCSHRARSDPDECRLIDYTDPVDRIGDRDDCIHYWKCLHIAANKDYKMVCVPDCRKFEVDTTECMTILRSNAGLAIR